MSNELQNVEKVAGAGQVASQPAPVTVAEIEAPKVYQHFGESVEIGSRKVVIRLVPKFSILPSDAGAQFIRDEVTKKIGSTWKKGTRDIIRGLSPLEEKHYMPTLSGIRFDSEQWNEKVRNYWAEFIIEVPNNDKGVELEVGFKEELTGIYPNTNAVPINLDDYIKWKFASQHKEVASTEADLDNMFIYTYQMVDKGLEFKKSEQAYTARKRADVLFAQLTNPADKKELSKVDWILEIHGGDQGNGINITGLTQVQKEMELEKTKDRNPSKFIEICSDKHLATKAQIRKAVGLGILIQAGNSYMLDNKVIGSSLQEAIAFLENANNQKDKMIIIEKLKEFSK